MKNVTANELHVLNQIATSEYGDGPGSTVWSYATPPPGCTARSLPGIFSSLVKKGLLSHEGWDDVNGKRIGMVKVTPEGIAAMAAAVGTP